MFIKIFSVTVYFISSVNQLFQLAKMQCKTINIHQNGTRNLN